MSAKPTAARSSAVAHPDGCGSILHHRAKMIAGAAILCPVLLATMVIAPVANAQTIAYLEVDTVSPGANWSDGFCSLREAILNVNNRNQGGSVAGECEEGGGLIGATITFSHAVFGGGASIALDASSGELPEITANWTTIDGWSAGGNTLKGPPLVTLDEAGLVNAGGDE